MIVYVAVLTALVVTPVALEFAIALIVSVETHRTGPEYSVELVVGVDPSVV